jgi:hypothetical protein
MANEDVIIKRTQKWVKNVIIGLYFCPFAKPVIDNDTAKFVVVTESTFEPCLQSLQHEFEYLDVNDQCETSLLIFPKGFESFDDYLELVSIANALLTDLDYEGIYQIASFHPDYCFDGAKYNDPANYTNRSPYPILHLIREESIESVLKPIEHPERIPERNIKVARDKGLKEMRQLLEDCFAELDGDKK